MNIRVDLDSGAWCRDGAFVENAYPDKFDVPDRVPDEVITQWITNCALYTRFTISCWKENAS